jgi:hypothetical protein
MYAEAKEGEMPPGAPLDDESLRGLRIWLACGAAEVIFPEQ